jgi:DNA relaxase NicK
VQGINGSLALYNLPAEEGGRYGHCLLSFPATVLASMDIRDVHKMMSALVGRWEFKTTRFDLALDDYSKRISYEMLDEAAKNRNYTGFRKPPVVHYNYDKWGNKVGWTFNFGNRRCDRVLRIYDKATESAGQIDAVRIEAEFHDNLAQQVMADWLAIPLERIKEDSPKYLAKVVVGSITFIERNADKNVSRMPIVGWWQSILDEIGKGIRHTVKAVRTTYEDKKNWINRQVSTTLTMFGHIMGMEDFYAWMQAQLKDGQSRLTDYHYAFIDHYKNQSASLCNT